VVRSFEYFGYVYLVGLFGHVGLLVHQLGLVLFRLLVFRACRVLNAYFAAFVLHAFNAFN
jgi:hypothetical protein